MSGDGLVEFLLARLDEREKWARDRQAVALLYGADSGRWVIEPDPDTVAQNDPAFVLADIAAKRRILVVHRSSALLEDGTPDPDAPAWEAEWCRGCGFDAFEEYACRLSECPTLLALASAYSGHPDYRQEWTP